jgi:hypothetical protein
MSPVFGVGNSTEEFKPFWLVPKDEHALPPVGCTDV